MIEGKLLEDDCEVVIIESDSSSDHSFHGETNLRLVEKGTPEYEQVNTLLKKGWKHSKKRKPKLARVLRIVSPEDRTERFVNYQERILSSLPVKEQYKTLAGNELLLFHGTKRACLVGESDEHVNMCDLLSCSLCRIAQASFDINRCGTHHKFSRFGKAIYTSSCSSKSDDYASSTHESAKCRVILLNRVTLGKQFHTMLNSTHLVQPPEGYHSVKGEPGVHLNYEEVVVYDNDAIRPAYMVVYTTEPRFDVRKALKLLFSTPLV